MDTGNQTVKNLIDADLDIMMENLIGKAIKELSQEDSLLYEYFVASPYMANFDDLNSPEHRVFIGSYPSLSPSLRTFIAASQTASSVYRIGQEYSLSDGKISQIGATIRELLLGNIFIKDFPLTLSSKLGLDNSKAGEIANKLISQSFGPIIEDVKRIQRSKFPDKISQLQKESLPDKMTQSTARPIAPKESLTPAQQLQQKSESNEQRATSDIGPRQSPVIPLPPTPQEPPKQPVSSFKSPVPEEMKRMPLTQSTARPDVPKPPAQFNNPLARPAPIRPPLPPPPDLRAETNELKRPGLTNPTRDQSLEAELEKVANVIDLRSKSEN